MNLEQVLNATQMSRYQYLQERGFNGSNEGTPEVLQATLGFVVDDTNGESHWISDALFKQFEELVNDDKDEPEEDEVEDIKVSKIFNVYNEERRDTVNAKAESEKPEFIRVTGGGYLIPDDYMPMEKHFTSEDNTIYETLYRLIRTTE